MSNLEGACQHLPLWHNLLYKPDAECVIGIDEHACLNQIEGVAQPNDSGQPLGAPVHEGNTPAAVEHAKLRVAGRDTKVTPAGQLQAASHAITVYGRYGRLVEVCDVADTHRARLPSASASRKAMDVLQVSPCAECDLASASEDEYVEVFILPGMPRPPQKAILRSLRQPRCEPLGD